MPPFKGLQDPGPGVSLDKIERSCLNIFGPKSRPFNVKEGEFFLRIDYC